MLDPMCLFGHAEGILCGIFIRRLTEVVVVVVLVLMNNAKGYKEEGPLRMAL